MTEADHYVRGYVDAVKDGRAYGMNLSGRVIVARDGREPSLTEGGAGDIFISMKWLAPEVYQKVSERRTVGPTVFSWVRLR